MSLDIEVRGDPGACRDTAQQLTRLAGVVDATGDSLTRQAHLSDLDFGGLSGEMFRGHAGRLASSADRTSGRCTRLARALNELALDLEDVRRLMDRAAAEARPWLAVDALSIRPPGVDPRPDDPWVVEAWSAWQRATLLVGRAREIEQRAQHDWRTALWQFAGATPPEVPWSLDALTDGSWPDDDGLPAYRPALGPHHVPSSAPVNPPTDHPTDSPHPSHHRHHHDHPSRAESQTQAQPQSQAQSQAQPQPQAEPGTVTPAWTAGVGHLPDVQPKPPTCGTTPLEEVLDVAD